MATKKKPSINAYIELPTFNRWKQDSRAGNIFGKPYRKNDKALLEIDAYVKAANNPKITNGTKQILYADIFFASMYWNNHYKSNTKMESVRRTAIMKLLLFAGNKLSKLHSCSLGALAKKLYEVHGKSLSIYGRGAPGDVLSIAQRESFKIIFKNGKAYRYDCLIWNRGNRSSVMSKDKLILADTSDYYKNMKEVTRRGIDEDIQFSKTSKGLALCGYIMSMSHELYLAPFTNIGAKGKGYYNGIYPRFHSDFMANKPVLCAGSIGIVKGQIKHLSNDSGHYKPPPHQITLVINQLKIAGVNVKKISVDKVLGV